MAVYKRVSFKNEFHLYMFYIYKLFFLLVCIIPEPPANRPPPYQENYKVKRIIIIIPFSLVYVYLVVIVVF